ncbi:hypothetical protein Tco_1236357 [Tanacetum coccineum]
MIKNANIPYPVIKNNSEQSQQIFTCTPKQGVEQLINAGVIPDDIGCLKESRPWWKYQGHSSNFSPKMTDCYLEISAEIYKFRCIGYKRSLALYCVSKTVQMSQICTNRAFDFRTEKDRWCSCLLEVGRWIGQLTDQKRFRLKPANRVKLAEMGNEPSQEQRLWNVEDEREARIQRAKKLVEEHWEEVAALKEYEVLYDYQTEYDSDDGSFECYSYDNLHLAYFDEKSLKWHI